MATGRKGCRKEAQPQAPGLNGQTVSHSGLQGSGQSLTDSGQALVPGGGGRQEWGESKVSHHLGVPRSERVSKDTRLSALKLEKSGVY